MKRVYILVEGPMDAIFLRRVLPQDVLCDAEIVPSGGRAGIPSLARTLLVRRKTPIAVVMNSGSLDADVIDEQQQSTEDLIRAANSSIPVKVISLVPEIEAWFFVTGETIGRITGQMVSSEWLALGRRDPKGVLQQLAANSQKKWDTEHAIAELNASDVEQIRRLPEVTELTTFLQQLQESDQAA